ncbi:hypothetical protein QTP88_014551 [Uroleucon formosanum]
MVSPIILTKYILHSIILSSNIVYNILLLIEHMYYKIQLFAIIDRTIMRHSREHSIPTFGTH